MTGEHTDTGVSMTPERDFGSRAGDHGRGEAGLAALAALVAERDRFRGLVRDYEWRTGPGGKYVLAEDAEGERDALRDALRRLASAEGFEGPGMIDGGTFPERELRARMRYAEDSLARALVGDDTA